MDTLGDLFDTDSLSGTYRCRIEAKAFESKKPSKRVPSYRGQETTTFWFSIKYEVCDENEDTYGMVFPDSNGFEGQLFEVFPYVKDLADLSPVERKEVRKQWADRKAALRAIGVPEGRLGLVTAEEVNGLEVTVKVRSAVSKKNNTSWNHYVDEVHPVEDDLEEDEFTLSE